MPTGTRVPARWRVERWVVRSANPEQLDATLRDRRRGYGARLDLDLKPIARIRGQYRHFQDDTGTYLMRVPARNEERVLGDLFRGRRDLGTLDGTLRQRKAQERRRRTEQRLGNLGDFWGPWFP